MKIISPQGPIEGGEFGQNLPHFLHKHESSIQLELLDVWTLPPQITVYSPSNHILRAASLLLPTTSNQVSEGEVFYPFWENMSKFAHVLSLFNHGWKCSWREKKIRKVLRHYSVKILWLLLFSNYHSNLGLNKRLSVRHKAWCAYKIKLRMLWGGMFFAPTHSLICGRILHWFLKM